MISSLAQHSLSSWDIKSKLSLWHLHSNELAILIDFTVTQMSNVFLATLILTINFLNRWLIDFSVLLVCYLQ